MSGARVLARSLRHFHPDIQVFVILGDRVSEKFDPKKEPFITIAVEQLDNIPNREFLLFKYDAMELNTALKSYGFNYLLTHYDFSKIIYLDTDILVFRPFDEIWRLLDTYSLVLTPHITEPYEDNFHPSEVTIKQYVDNLSYSNPFIINNSVIEKTLALNSSDIPISTFTFSLPELRFTKTWPELIDRTGTRRTSSF